MSRDMKGEMWASAPQTEDILRAVGSGWDKLDELKKQQEGWCGWSLPSQGGGGDARRCRPGGGL